MSNGTLHGVSRAGVLLGLLVLATGMPLWAQGGAAPGTRVLTLESALRLALERNHELRDARLGLEGAGSRVAEAWSSVFPSLDLDASYTRNLAVPATFLPRIFVDPDADPDELIAVRFGADNSWGLQLRAEQPLFDPAVFVGVGAASRYRAWQEELVRGRAQQVATRVRLDYYAVLLAQEGVRLSENSVRRVRQVLQETRSMNRAGLASSYDVLRLEVELANLEPNLRRSGNAVAAAKRVLAVDLALGGADSLELAGSLAELAAAPLAAASGSPPPPDRSLAASAPVSGPGVAGSYAGTGTGTGTVEEVAATDTGAGVAGGVVAGAQADPEWGSDAARFDDVVLEQALASRSDLRQLELLTRLRATELRLEQVEYLPKVSLFGVYSVNAQQNGAPNFFGESSAQRAYGRQIGVQVSLPLFAGFRRPARLEQKRAALRQAETQRELAVAQASSEVRTLREQAEESWQRLEAQRLAIEQARRGFEIASAQYREGVGSQLEVTDAELALRQSEFNLAEAGYDYLVARARLDAALGRVPMVDTGAQLALNLERTIP